MAYTKKKVDTEEEVMTKPVVDDSSNTSSCVYEAQPGSSNPNMLSDYEDNSSAVPIVSYDTEQINPNYWKIVSCADGISTYVSNNDSGCLVLVNCFGNITMQYIDRGRYDDEKGLICRMV